MSGKVSSLIVMITVCTVASGTPTAQAQPRLVREYQIKAAFLYNFVKFVEWPDDTFTDSSTPLTLCVLGEDPFGAALDSLKGKAVKGRKLAIKRFESDQELEGCHVLFISLPEKNHLAQIIETLKDSSILTVGEMEQFAELGGIINFTIERSKIRFIINVNAAEQAGLKISSKLLRLAKVIR